ncbi:MAG: hypothetical protein P9L97_10515 [Candidatus Tenebribacter davisii]|jgi:hypothetical protein|nr:hypothetical protein [Candidatus Tenebribacter davisii]
MKYTSILFVILVFSLLTGCAYNAGIIQKEDISYIKLTGNLVEISLQIDDNEIIPLIEPTDNTVYEIDPGLHLIRVYRNGEMIVKRNLFFDGNITKEVNVK